MDQCDKAAIDAVALETDVRHRMALFGPWEKSAFWRGLIFISLSSGWVPKGRRHSSFGFRTGHDLPSEKSYRDFVYEELRKNIELISAEELNGQLTYFEELQARLHEEQSLAMLRYMRKYWWGIRAGMALSFLPILLLIISLLVPPFSQSTTYLPQVALVCWWYAQPTAIWLLTQRIRFPDLPGRYAERAA